VDNVRERRTVKKHAFMFVFVLVTTLVVAGAAFAAVKQCNGGTCRGTSGDDKIYGSVRNEIVFGEQGDDRLYGRGGEDLLKGDPGRDTVYGQEGPDRVKGGTGRDMVYGGPGDDLVRGGTHDQTNDGVRDILDCGPGVDTVYYTPGTDVLRDCEVRNPPEQ